MNSTKLFIIWATYHCCHSQRHSPINFLVHRKKNVSNHDRIIYESILIAKPWICWPIGPLMYCCPSTWSRWRRPWFPSIHKNSKERHRFHRRIAANCVGSLVTCSGTIGTAFSISSDVTTRINWEKRKSRRACLLLSSGPHVCNTESTNVSVVCNTPIDSVDKYGNRFHWHPSRFGTAECGMMTPWNGY